MSLGRLTVVPHKEMEKEKILIIKHGALGDFVLSVGTMRYIREMHPDASFSLMTMSPFVSMAKQMDMFDEYIVDNRPSAWNLPYMFKLLRQIARQKFTYIYDLQASSRTRYRYYPMLRWLMPQSFVWVNYRKFVEYRIEKKGSFGLGRQIRNGVHAPIKVSDLTFLKGEGKHFDELPERYVLMIPGCSPNHPYKRWPIENFQKLVQRLADEGIHSVVIGTNIEAEEVNAIASSSPMAVNMLNKTSLLDVPQLAVRAIACVGNDTGPSHMASLSGCFSIALYDNRTKQGALRGPDSVNMVSPDLITKITVDSVWDVLSPRLESANV